MAQIPGGKRVQVASPSTYMGMSALLYHCVTKIIVFNYVFNACVYDMCISTEYENVNFFKWYRVSVKLTFFFYHDICTN